MKEGLIRDKIRVFLSKDREFRAPKGLKDTTPLVQLGVFDSFSVIKLVTFLEKEFEIRIHPEDLLEENFSTVAALEKLVIRKQRPVNRKSRGG